MQSTNGPGSLAVRVRLMVVSPDGTISYPKDFDEVTLVCVRAIRKARGMRQTARNAAQKVALDRYIGQVSHAWEVFFGLEVMTTVQLKGDSNE